MGQCRNDFSCTGKSGDDPIRANQPGERGAVSELHQNVEELSGIDVGYRKDGAIDAILEGDVQEELSTVIALQHGVGLRAEALSSATGAGNGTVTERGHCRGHLSARRGFAEHSELYRRSAAGRTAQGCANLRGKWRQGNLERWLDAAEG